MSAGPADETSVAMLRAAETMERAARIMFACTRAQAQIAGMEARNAADKLNGAHPWYQEGNFREVALELRAAASQ